MQHVSAWSQARLQPQPDPGSLNTAAHSVRRARHQAQDVCARQHARWPHFGIADKDAVQVAGHQQVQHVAKPALHKQTHDCSGGTSMAWAGACMHACGTAWQRSVGLGASAAKQSSAWQCTTDFTDLQPLAGLCPHLQRAVGKAGCAWQRLGGSHAELCRHSEARGRGLEAGAAPPAAATQKVAHRLAHLGQGEGAAAGQHRNRPHVHSSGGSGEWSKASGNALSQQAPTSPLLLNWPQRPEMQWANKCSWQKGAHLLKVFRQDAPQVRNGQAAHQLPPVVAVYHRQRCTVKAGAGDRRMEQPPHQHFLCSQPAALPCCVSKRPATGAAAATKAAAARTWHLAVHHAR